MPSRELTQLIAVSGLDHVLNIRPSLTDALAAAGGRAADGAGAEPAAP